MILHIINGDCALEGFRSGNFPGDVLIWRENYLQGHLPEISDITGFNRFRAAELHKFAPQKPEEEIFSELQSMHHKLAELRAGDKVILWLDCCEFDEALKKRLLELIIALPEMPELYLVQEDVTWNQEAFSRYCNWQDYLYSFRQ